MDFCFQGHLWSEAEAPILWEEVLLYNGNLWQQQLDKAFMWISNLLWQPFSLEFPPFLLSLQAYFSFNRIFWHLQRWTYCYFVAGFTLAGLNREFFLPFLSFSLVAFFFFLIIITSPSFQAPPYPYHSTSFLHTKFFLFFRLHFGRLRSKLLLFLVFFSLTIFSFLPPRISSTLSFPSDRTQLSAFPSFFKLPWCSTRILLNSLFFFPLFLRGRDLRPTTSPIFHQHSFFSVWL